jgi:hypothetical protein
MEIRQTKARAQQILQQLSKTPIADISLVSKHFLYLAICQLAAVADQNANLGRVYQTAGENFEINLYYVDPKNACFAKYPAERIAYLEKIATQWREKAAKDAAKKEAAGKAAMDGVVNVAESEEVPASGDNSQNGKIIPFKPKGAEPEKIPAIPRTGTVADSSASAPSVDPDQAEDTEPCLSLCAHGQHKHNCRPYESGKCKKVLGLGARCNGSEYENEPQPEPEKKEGAV